jgi:hypothetical protein
MALPRGPLETRTINGLAEGLGHGSPVEGQGDFNQRPKPGAANLLTKFPKCQILATPLKVVEAPVDAEGGDKVAAEVVEAHGPGVAMKRSGNPGSSRKAHRADREATGHLSCAQDHQTRSRPWLLDRFPDAADLACYDGQILIGRLVDLGWPQPTHAFGAEEKPLGSYRSRKLAFAAVSEAYDAPRRP